jgi:hypothetical protein
MKYPEVARHHIYHSNLKLAEIRANIENEIGKGRNILFDMDEHGAEVNEYVDVKQAIAELEVFYEKLA